MTNVLTNTLAELASTAHENSCSVTGRVMYEVYERIEVCTQKNHSTN